MYLKCLGDTITFLSPKDLRIFKKFKKFINDSIIKLVSSNISKRFYFVSIFDNRMFDLNWYGVKSFTWEFICGINTNTLGFRLFCWVWILLWLQFKHMLYFYSWENMFEKFQEKQVDDMVCEWTFKAFNETIGC